MGKTGITPAALKAALNGDLENFLAATTPGGIEAQEAAGQRAFVASETLPKECPREKLEKLGFVFGEEADDLFVRVAFPTGWSKRATDHSMWTDLLDPQGRKRGGIFYKAAFYDRRAEMYLTPRYHAQVRPQSGWHNVDTAKVWEAVVIDADGNLICCLDMRQLPDLKTVAPDRQRYGAYLEAKDAMEAKAREWLVEHYPSHMDPLAYWD